MKPIKDWNGKWLLPAIIPASMLLYVVLSGCSLFNPYSCQAPEALDYILPGVALIVMVFMSARK